MQLRPTSLQQPTGPLQLGPRALRVVSPWSLGLLDSDPLELRRQLARLPSNFFNLDYGGLWMDRILEVTPVPDVCWMLLAPHSTTTAPHRTNPTLAPHAVHASPLRAPPVPRTPSQPRAAVTESENSACFFSRAPFIRWNTRFQYGPCFSRCFSCRH